MEKRGHCVLGSGGTRIMGGERERRKREREREKKEKEREGNIQVKVI